MKKTKITSKLPVIISAVVSGVALTVVVGIAVKLRKEVESLEFKLDILEDDIGDMKSDFRILKSIKSSVKSWNSSLIYLEDEIKDMKSEIQNIKVEKTLSEIYNNRLNMEDLLKEVDIPDDSDIDEDEIL